MSNRLESREEAKNYHLVEQLNRLKEEHSSLERKLDKINEKPLSNSGEKLRKELKKKKLIAKDKILEMTRETVVS